MYQLVGNNFAGRHSVPLYLLSTRAKRSAQTQQKDIRKVDEKSQKKEIRHNMIGIVNIKPKFLDIAPIRDHNVRSTDAITEQSSSDVVVGDIIDEKYES